MTIASNPVPNTRRITGTLHTRGYVHPIPVRNENPARKKAEESEVTGRYRNSGQKDHKGAR